MSMEIGIGRRVASRARYLGGGLAFAGGLLLVAGAFLPWLSMFEGLKTLRGVAGPNGRILAGGGAVCVVGGAMHLARGGRRLSLALGVFGAMLAAFAAYLVAQLLGAMHSLDGMLLAKLGPGLFVSAAGSLLVIGSVFVSEEPAGTALGSAVGSIGQSLAGAVALTAAGAAVIHLAVAPDHFQEFPVFGVFFILSGVAQLAWAWLVWVRASHTLLVAGAVGNALILALWVVSRTAGLPIGPEHWAPEAIGSADLVCSAYEVLAVLGAVWLLRHGGRGLGNRASLAVRWGSVALILPLTIAAVMAGAGALGHAPMHM